ncbi:hypothetical protein DFP72DRAFT_1082424 [Ephemerocybe angulata]|uniref:Uncharacterized protein n=1 Tax=Ephemerocybe angulata TaxID=980116 RepID=A0A8H6H873_9AGAR|nr:hypothetical protein DFP72DRAFT_1082424 [Tulosesus angulatus]
MPIWLNNLSISLQLLFQRTGNLRDLGEAISIKRRVLEITPEGHANMPVWLNSLGISLDSLFKRTGDLRDLTETISTYRSSAVYTSGSPPILAAFDTAIYLITLTATLEQTLQNRYTQLQDSSGIPLQAASAALTLKRVYKALEWLEQGRCLVWGQLNNPDTPRRSTRI